MPKPKSTKASAGRKRGRELTLTPEQIARTLPRYRRLASWTRRHRGTATDAAAPEPGSDGELLTLAKLVEDAVDVRVRLARGLVRRPKDYRHVADLAEAKRRSRRALQGVLRALQGLRDEDDAPYRDARMYLTGCIVAKAVFHRPLSDDNRPGTVHAAGVAGSVATRFPALAAKMREPARIERIRVAIESCAASRKKVPWKLIAAVWDGIEAQSKDAEVWRQDWHRYQRRTTNRS